MKIELKEITVRDLTDGYEDNAEEGGIVGYGGRLDIRPPYQREFVYLGKQRDAVIDTVTKGYPLNVMYWAVREDGDYEIIDGQQRTISICQYVQDKFLFKGLLFSNLQPDKQEQILNYELTVYFCTGVASEKLEWFKTVNIAGKPLNEQELRNAVYAGPWVSDARRYFSKKGCAAHGVGGNYLSGKPINQDYLQTVIKWLSSDSIEEYMARRQHEPNAEGLWLYFREVINWTKALFPKHRDAMKGVPWGFLYNDCKDKKFDPAELEKKVAELMEDDDVTNKKGVYSYVLTGEEKRLNIRAFSVKQKRETHERQKGICPHCKKHFELKEMEADHIQPWHEGGKTIAENCQMLCKPCNRAKAGK